MKQDATIAAAEFAGALLNGAALAVVFLAVTHVLRRYTTQILFVGLLVAAFAYVVFAVRASAGPIWLLVEALGVIVYGAIGWTGLRGSVWWLAAAWTLHTVWDVGLHYVGAGRSLAPPLSYPIPCLSFDLLVAGYASYRAGQTGRWRTRGSSGTTAARGVSGS